MENGKKSYMLIVVLLLVMVGVGYMMVSRSQDGASTMSTTPSVVPTSMTVDNAAGTSEITQAEVKEFTLATGDDYSFTPNAMTVKKGDTVRVTLTNSSEEMKHNFVLDEFKVESDEISGGETTTVEFVASEVGTFEFYCSLWDHREKGQVGTLTVTE